MATFTLNKMFGAVLLSLLVISPSRAAISVEHAEFGFSLQLPDDFERVIEDESPNDFVRVYRVTPTTEALAVVFAVERLKGRLPRLDPERLPSNPNVHTTTERWGEFDVLVGRVYEEIEGYPAIVINAQVPLQPEAIQLKLIGPAASEPQLSKLLRETLVTLQGSTNWLSSEQRTQRLHIGTQKLTVTGFVAVLIVLGVAAAIRNLWPQPAV